jgi:hypothetical protein
MDPLLKSPRADPASREGERTRNQCNLRLRRHRHWFIVAPMPPADLTTSERGELSAAIRSAFYDAQRLEELLYYGEGLGVTLADVAPPAPLPGLVTSVIKWAEAEGKTPQLVEAAYKKVPGNTRLGAFYSRYKGSAQRQITRDTLERLTSSATRFQDPASWRDRMAAAEACVCCIVIDGQRTGTGALIGPGLVLTNYHVIEGSDWQKTRVEFDYQVGANGALIPSRFYPVSAAPLATSPWHKVDTQDPKPPAPPPDETALDFALLPVSGEPENTLLPTGRQRDVLPPPQPQPMLRAEMPLLILQHPKKAQPALAPGDLLPLKFAFDAVTDLNENDTRVRYRVNTEAGASGSPCFDPDWNLVALHHAGDPGNTIQAKYNEGIPIATIRKNLPRAVRSQLNWT